MSSNTCLQFEELIAHKNNIGLDFWKNLSKMNKWGILLYECGTWSMFKQKKETYLNTVLQKMLKIIWTDNITNTEVYERAKEK